MLNRVCELLDKCASEINAHAKLIAALTELTDKHTDRLTRLENETIGTDEPIGTEH